MLCHQKCFMIMSQQCRGGLSISNYSYYKPAIMFHGQAFRNGTLLYKGVFFMKVDLSSYNAHCKKCRSRPIGNMTFRPVAHSSHPPPRLWCHYDVMFDDLIVGTSPTDQHLHVHFVQRRTLTVLVLSDTHRRNMLMRKPVWYVVCVYVQ